MGGKDCSVVWRALLLWTAAKESGHRRVGGALSEQIGIQRLIAHGCVLTTLVHPEKTPCELLIQASVPEHDSCPKADRKLRKNILKRGFNVLTRTVLGEAVNFSTQI